jgi:pectate lyase
MKSRLLIAAVAMVAVSLSGCARVLEPVATIAAVDTVVPSAIPALTTAPQAAPSAVPAFPGAEGMGSETHGGRGGQVIEVTNLDDAGPGSLRSAIEASGPRIVVFRVAGTINLQTNLTIRNPYITIAGQTAPGQGITLRDASAAVEALIDIETHDVIVRYLTLRAGPPSAGDAMMIQASSSHDTYHVVIDHNSMSWAVDRDLATWYDVHDITIQWNIFSEALNCSINAKGCHSKGVLLGGYASDEQKDKLGAYNLSFHHNLMAQDGERNPYIKVSGVVDVVNNVVYDPFGTFSHIDMIDQLAQDQVNYVGNYYKPGPDTVVKYGIRAINPGKQGAGIYVKGNIGPGRENETLPEINIINPDSRQYVVPAPFPAAVITTTDAQQAYEQVLEDAGANKGLDCEGNFVPRRDAIDARIVGNVRDSTGKIIDDPSQVGGWLTIAPASPCADTDHDGMPDAWEQKYSFNPNDASDAVGDANENGYTNLEEFLNGTRPTP